MTFMDILRKQNNLSVIDKLTENLTNKDVNKMLYSIKQAKKNMQLSLDITLSKNKKKKLIDDIDVYFSSLETAIPIQGDRQLPYAVDVFMNFFNWYKKYINSIEVDKNKEDVNAEDLINELYVVRTKKKIKDDGNKHIEELNKILSIATTRYSNPLLEQEEGKATNQQNAAYLLNSLLVNASEKEEYETSFSALRRRGFFNRPNLRKLVILIRAIKEDKNISEIRIRGRLENQSTVFGLLKKQYGTKQGYEILERVLEENQIFLPSPKEDNDMVFTLLEAYKGKKEIKNSTRRLKRILLSKTIQDDIKFFDNFTQFQRIILYAEEMYTNLQDKIADEISENKTKVDSLFAEYYDMADTKDEEVFSSFTEGNQIDGELDNFKIFYSSMAWLVFKIKDAKLDYSNKLRINARILNKLNLDKNEIYEMYDSVYSHISLSKLTTGLMEEAPTGRVLENIMNANMNKNLELLFEGKHDAALEFFDDYEEQREKLSTWDKKNKNKLSEYLKDKPELAEQLEFELSEEEE